MLAEVFFLGITIFVNIKSYSKEFRNKVPLEIIFLVIILIVVYLISRYMILIKRFLLEILKWCLFGICFILFSPISFHIKDPMLKPNSGTMLGNHSMVVYESMIFECLIFVDVVLILMLIWTFSLVWMNLYVCVK